MADDKSITSAEPVVSLSRYASRAEPPYRYSPVPLPNRGPDTSGAVDVRMHLPEPIELTDSDLVARWRRPKLVDEDIAERLRLLQAEQLLRDAKREGLL